MVKNILILKGSPREKGNSATLADRAATGAVDAGAQVESIYLHGLDIRACDACNLCNDGKCVIEDDMQPLYPKLAAADAILLASPIYWFTFSSQLKLCIDRWYGFQGHRYKEINHKQFGSHPHLRRHRSLYLRCHQRHPHLRNFVSLPRE